MVDLINLSEFEKLPKGVFKQVETTERKYVAFKKSPEKWAINIGPVNWDSDRVVRDGIWLHDFAIVKDVVPCDEDVLMLYQGL